MDTRSELRFKLQNRYLRSYFHDFLYDTRDVEFFANRAYEFNDIKELKSWLGDLHEHAKRVHDSIARVSYNFIRTRPDEAVRSTSDLYKVLTECIECRKTRFVHSKFRVQSSIAYRNVEIRNVLDFKLCLINLLGDLDILSGRHEILISIIDGEHDNVSVTVETSVNLSHNMDRITKWLNYEAQGSEKDEDIEIYNVIDMATQSFPGFQIKLIEYELLVVRFDL